MGKFFWCCAGALPASCPDSEVVARPKRRSYTAEYKLRILQEAEAAAATPAPWAPFFVAKVCTPRCWLIGGESEPMGSGRP